MQLKIVVNPQEAELYEDRNVQLVTEGFFPQDSFKLESIDLVVAFGMDEEPNMAQCQYLEHLHRAGKIREFRLFKDNGEEVHFIREVGQFSLK